MAVAGLLLVSPGARAGAAPVALGWTTAAGGPPALQDPAMAYDASNRTAVLFGGTIAGGAVSNQTWIWNGSAWRQAGGGPPARTGASMAFCPACAPYPELVLFGGRGVGGGLLSDTWAWNGAAWTVQTPSGTSPPGREGAAMATDPLGHLVLFGGTAASPPTPASPATSTSTSTPAQSAADAPSAVRGDTWTWDGTGWTSSPTGPPARTAAAMAYDPVHRQTVLFGGSTAPSGAGRPSSSLGDTWVWSGSAWAPAAPAHAPSPRWGAAMASDPDAGGVVLVGGSSGTTPTADPWVWSGRGWSALDAAGAVPTTTSAGSADDVAAGAVVFYGGQDSAGAPAGTTEVLAPIPPASTTAPAAMVPAPAPTGSPPATIPTVIARPTPPPAVTTTGSRRAASTTTTAVSSSSGSAAQSAPVPEGVAPMETVHPGSPVLLLGAGFLAGAPITVTFHSRPSTIGTFIASTRGTFSATVTVPRDATSGPHHFVMSGAGPSGRMTVLSTAVLVVAVAPNRRDVHLQRAVMVGIAVLLPIGTWLALVVLGRRRWGADRKA